MNPLIRWLGAKKATGHVRAAEHQEIQEHDQDADAVRPYELLSDYIDSCIQMFDRTKLALDDAIDRGQLQ